MVLYSSIDHREFFILLFYKEKVTSIQYLYCRLMNDGIKQDLQSFLKMAALTLYLIISTLNFLKRNFGYK